MLAHRRVRRVALIDPVGDAGIGGYSHELAMGLCANEVRVDLYTRGASFASALPRAYRLVPVFGVTPDAFTVALDDALSDASELPQPPALGGEPTESAAQLRPALAPYFDLLDRRSARTEHDRAPQRSHDEARDVTRPTQPAAATRVAATNGERQMSHALARHVRRQQYDLLWTQWPDLGPLGADVCSESGRAGVPLVHTVHNVLPHERCAGDATDHRATYRRADALVVHSDAAGRSLTEHFPDEARKLVHSRHGLYTIYPRASHARAYVRSRLRLRDDQTALLIFGGVRPYKNLDATIDALHAVRARREDVVLVVAGWEWGYHDTVPGDALGRTRRLVASLGLHDQVRLLPGPFGVRQTAELFEAADAVALPYIESFGSGVLCMAMTYGKHVLATDAGGMHEYLATYEHHTPVRDASTSAIADAIACLPRTGATDARATRCAHLEWPAIARRALDDLGSLVHARRLA